jgi:LAO/AO transport system kinase
MVEQLLGGHRASLSRAITLVESTRPQDGVQARLLIDELHRALTTRSAEPRGRQQEGVAPIVGAFRLGLCGPPGVGKSTLIEALGCWLLDEEARGVAHRVAVIAVDPSSVLSGGSILGDKTRMVTLASHPRAFVRPSPTRGVLGGVARRTEEVLFLCEAAGYDVVLVETVGVVRATALPPLRWRTARRGVAS